MPHYVKAVNHLSVTDQSLCPKVCSICHMNSWETWFPDCWNRRLEQPRDAQDMCAHNGARCILPITATANTSQCSTESTRHWAPRLSWSMLNCFQTGQGQCAIIYTNGKLHHQTNAHVDSHTEWTTSCPITKRTDNGLLRLHPVHCVIWLRDAATKHSVNKMKCSTTAKKSTTTAFSFCSIGPFFCSHSKSGQAAKKGRTNSRCNCHHDHHYQCQVLPSVDAIFPSTHDVFHIKSR